MKEVITLAITVVALAVSCFVAGRGYGQRETQPYVDYWQRRAKDALKREDERWPSPPVCADRWHRITVPTCDGGTQVMHEEPQ